MTKDDLLKSFLEDSMFREKGIIKSEQHLNSIKFSEPSGNSLIEIIKLAIRGTVDREGENIIRKNINNYLNQK